MPTTSRTILWSKGSSLTEISRNRWHYRLPLIFCSYFYDIWCVPVVSCAENMNFILSCAEESLKIQASVSPSILLVVYAAVPLQMPNHVESVSKNSPCSISKAEKTVLCGKSTQAINENKWGGHTSQLKVIFLFFYWGAQRPLLSCIGESIYK